MNITKDQASSWEVTKRTREDTPWEITLIDLMMAVSSSRSSGISSYFEFLYVFSSSSFCL